MKTYIFNIENIGDLNPSMKGYYALLSETKPEVEFEPGYEQRIENFLWYNIEPILVPEAYGSYFKEKLGLTEQDTAHLVDEWNTTLSTGTTVYTRFVRIITIGNSRFGIIEAEDENVYLVLQGNHTSFPHQVSVKGAGYRWAYLTDIMVLSDQVLFEMFGLTPVEMASFREQW